MKYIFLSARFKPLIVGAGPLFFGIFLSFSSWDSFSWLLNGSVFLSVFCIQIATHFFNDALDFLKGADTPSRKGPKRPVQKGLVSPSLLFKAGFLCLFLAGLSGLYIVWQGGWFFLFVGLLSLALAYFYTGGPYPLAYTGLADFFVLLFFGLIPSSFVFYLNAGFWSMDSFVAGFQCGLLALSLLTVNNLRDEEEDRQAGKKTLVVRFGRKWGIREWTLAHYLPYFLGAYWFFKGSLKLCFLPFILFPFSVYMQKLLEKTFEKESLYGRIFASSLLYYLFFVSLLCLGFLWG